MAVKTGRWQEARPCRMLSLFPRGGEGCVSGWHCSAGTVPVGTVPSLFFLRHRRCYDSQIECDIIPYLITLKKIRVWFMSILNTLRQGATEIMETVFI